MGRQSGSSAALETLEARDRLAGFGYPWSEPRVRILPREQDPAIRFDRVLAPPGLLVESAEPHPQERAGSQGLQIFDRALGISPLFEEFRRPDRRGREPAVPVRGLQERER